MDIASYLSWAREVFSFLWQKGWRGKIAVGAIVVLGACAAVWGSKAGPASVSPKEQITKVQIKGAVSNYSPDGWPIIETTVRLSGVGPIAAGERDRFARWITSHGGYLECDSSDNGSTFRCLTPQRFDVTQAMLLNGAAQATHDADPHYRAAEAQAKKMGRDLR
jgi:hypothetical protein